MNDPDGTSPEGFTSRDVLILGIIVAVGALIFMALPAFGVCVIGCPLTPPFRH